jgi:ribosomal protein S18 acetylase RimI-like enzyme
MMNISGAIRTIDLFDARTAMCVRQLQLDSYMAEAHLIGTRDFPPLQETAEAIRLSGCLGYGYYHGDQLVGCLTFKCIGDVIDVHRLMVAPSYFRCGIATLLIRHLSKHQHGSRILVQTAERNQPAVMFYRKLGFRETERYVAEGGIALVCFELTCAPEYDS